MRQKTENESASPTNEGRSAVSRLRLLDFDDLFLLSHLLEGATIAATARQLGLTQPAITQRVRKIERVFGEAILQKAGRHVRLTKEGRAICIKAADALAVMRTVAAEPMARHLTIGSSATVASTLLFPAATEMLSDEPSLLCHIVVGSHDDMVAALDNGAADAWLTAVGPSSFAAAAGRLEQFDLGEEDYLFVAREDIAARIAGPDSLSEQLLIELDRSYPLLTRVDPAVRSTLRFRDAWFVGSLANVQQAVVAGLGVAILPSQLAKPLLAAGKLKPILPAIDLTPLTLSIVCRREASLAPLVARLAASIARIRGRV